MTTNPDPIDVRVGKRVRDLRISRGLNQTQLGKAIEKTFQQVQKYEKGVNRISVSVLVRISTALKVPPAYWFEDLPPAEVVDTPDALVLPPRLQRALESLPAKRLGVLTEVAEAMTPAA